MPSGKYARRYTSLRRRAKKKAVELVLKKINKIAEPDYSLYQGIFAFNILVRESKKVRVRAAVLVFLFVVNYYEIFKRQDGYLWGIAVSTNKMDLLVKEAMGAGLIERLPKRRGYYYLTIKGQAVVADFQKIYAKAVRNIRKDNEHGNPNTNRKAGKPLIKFD